MLKEKILESLEEIKVISDPFRLKILFLFEEENTPKTVKQMAVKLEEVASRVHYHVKELERIGVLEIVETKERAGILEKFYLPTAENFRVERNLNDPQTGNEAHMQVGTNLFQVMQQDFTKNNSLRGPEDRGNLSYGLCHLKEEERKELEALIQGFLEGKSPREGTKPYMFGYTLFRKLDNKGDDGHGDANRD